MKFRLSVLLTFVFVAAMTAFGQTAVQPAGKMPTVTEILDKYAQAIGGKAANEKIKSRVTTGTVLLSPMGLGGTVETYTAAPNKFYSKVTLTGVGDILEGFDGTIAWSINPISGNREKQGEELLQTKLSSQFDRELNLSQLYPKMELKGIEKVGEKDAYVLVGTPEGTQPETFYFDVASGLLVRQDATVIAAEGNQATQTFFDDYREVDGVKIPFKSRLVLPQYEIIVTTTNVKNNVAIEDTKFKKP